MSDIAYQFIDSDEGLRDISHRLIQSKIIAVDTEFLRERTFYPRAGLIQLATNDETFLVDPLSCDLTPFLNILENPHVCKVMHSMSEDLDVFLALGVYEPVNMFDTQVAASWLGAGLSLSLQNLVQTHHGVVLNKSQTRTDWLARPLSSAQLSYAVEDVAYLLSIAETQKELLAGVGLVDYVMEENRLIVSPSDEDHDLGYLQYGRAANMDMPTLNRFQRLVSWRERVARRDDRPKPHLLKDNEMTEVARDCDTREKLNKHTFHPAFRRRYLTELTAVLFEATDTDLQPVKRLQDIPQGKRLLGDLKQQLVKIAESEGIPVDVMPSKRLLEQILKHLYVPWYPKPKQWSGWRKSFILQALNDLQIDVTPLGDTND